LAEVNVDRSRYTALFLADGREHLKRATAELLAWERDLTAEEPVAEVFRAFHSLKSSAATMGYDQIAQVAHQAEHLLDAVRRRELDGSPGIVGLLLQAVDMLDQGLEPSTHGEPLPDAEPLAQAISRLASTGRKVPAPRPAARASGRFMPEAAAMRAVRIDPARLDELLNTAGELVVARNRLGSLAAGLGDPELDQVTGRLDTLVRSLHAGVLRARLAPGAELFGRFPRIVRDLGESLGKLVRLTVVGEGIECDRAVLEALVDPLIHLLRNAVDHGIERPAERLEAGKPAEGQLVLSGERRRDWIVIRLQDDGRGIDRDRAAAHGRVLGLLTDDAGPLSDEDLLHLMTRPGFTLADQVTTVSGRGVGMDAVLSTVRTLGGRLDCRSEWGRGTSFEITVPLTAAVQRVLLVGLGSERYAIPFRIVREAIYPDRGTVTSSAVVGSFQFRGQAMPLVDLARATGTARSAGLARQPVLLVEWGTRGGAVAVDSLLGQHDVLLERIEPPRDLPGWVTGATILADGSPAFVLDPTALF
jgi:two-component system chemotaxis sensor kinase CheA